jgi:hypothetical protein
MIRLSFINGIGGNWLKQVILNYPIDASNGNFHKKLFSYQKIQIDHSLDDFDYLYYGEHWFNFYLNQVYKLHHLDQDIFSTQTYQTCFLHCMTATHLLRFKTLASKAFFKFEDLLFDPDRFLECIHQIQNQLKLENVSQASFFESRNKFFSTCVDVENMYSNHDNVFWICYALGELQCLGFTPSNFIVSDIKNKELCLEFIDQHRQHLSQDTPVYHFNSGVTMPEFPTT